MAVQSDFKATYSHFIRKAQLVHIKSLAVSVAHGNYHRVGACGAL